MGGGGGRNFVTQVAKASIRRGGGGLATNVHSSFCNSLNGED